jgi:hypothetical protein
MPGKTIRSNRTHQCHGAWWIARCAIRLNDTVRHHRSDDDEPGGLLPRGAADRPLPPNADDDLVPGRVWDSGGPGSASAASRGCTCPMLPNDPRAGLGLLIAPDCPVHRARLE